MKPCSLFAASLISSRRKTLGVRDTHSSQGSSDVHANLSSAGRCANDRLRRKIPTFLSTRRKRPQPAGINKHSRPRGARWSVCAANRGPSVQPEGPTQSVSGSPGSCSSSGVFGTIWENNHKNRLMTLKKNNHKMFSGR